MKISQQDWKLGDELPTKLGHQHKVIVSIGDRIQYKNWYDREVMSSSLRYVLKHLQIVDVYLGFPINQAN